MAGRRMFAAAELAAVGVVEGAVDARADGDVGVDVVNGVVCGAGACPGAFGGAAAAAVAVDAVGVDCETDAGFDDVDAGVRPAGLGCVDRGAAAAAVDCGAAVGAAPPSLSPGMQVSLSLSSSSLLASASNAPPRPCACGMPLRWEAVGVPPPLCLDRVRAAGPFPFLPSPGGCTGDLDCRRFLDDSDMVRWRAGTCPCAAACCTRSEEKVGVGFSSATGWQ